MSFFSDLVKGNFSNLGTDLSHDPVGTGIGAGALILGTAGLAAPFLGAAGLGGLGAEAGALSFGAAEGAGALGAAEGAGALGAGAAGATDLGALVGGGAGADTLLGGAGGDALVGGGAGAAGTGAGAFGVPGGLGATDVLTAGSTGGFDTLGAGSGTETLVGAAGEPQIGASSIAMPGEGASADGGFNLQSILGKNPLGAGVAAGGLAYNVLQGQSALPTTKALQGQSKQISDQAAQYMQQGGTLESYLTNGNLPPNMQAQVDTQVKAMKAKIIQAYGAQGASTDPSKNTSLAQDLNNVDMQGLTMAATLEQQLFQNGANLISQGAALTNMNNELLKTLSNIDQTQTANIGKSIASFAAALGGGGTTIKLAA